MTSTPSPTVEKSASEEMIKKINMAVEGENAAVWAFGYLLSFIPDENKDYAFSVFNLHRDIRDRLRLILRELGLTPPRPKEVYEVPIVVKDMVTAYELASFVENRLTNLVTVSVSCEPEKLNLKP